MSFPLSPQGGSVSFLPGTLPPPPPIEFDDLGAGNQAKKASPLPLIVVLFSIPLSGAIYFFLPQLQAEWWSLVGYALTPLVAVLATGWDSVSQMAGRKNPWFVIRPGFSKVLRVLVAISLIIGVVHIWRISDWLARTAIQQGWPFLT